MEVIRRHYAPLGAPADMGYYPLPEYLPEIHDSWLKTKPAVGSK